MKTNNLRGKLKAIIRNFNFALILVLILPQVGCYEPTSGLSFIGGYAPDISRLEDVTGSNGSVGRSIDPHTARSIDRYGGIIQKYSSRYDLDWRLVLSVMRQESQFQHDAVSHRGAYGLMQIMPVTQAELAGKLRVEETATPYNNIKAGIYYLRSLYRFFEDAREEDRIRLTLAAYNAGLGRIIDARAIARYLGDDPDSWRAVRDALPLLSKRYYTLHRNIWPEGRPKSGFFRAHGETILYVENVMQFYEEYRLALK